METSTLPSIGPKDDPRLTLQVENKMKNIFVTQLQETREQKDGDTNLIPVITESKSRILETGVNTMQRTLVLKKQVELDKLDSKFAHKRQEFQVRKEAQEHKRADLQHKQQQIKDKVAKFEKFVEENELKHRRALKKFQVERRLNNLKHKELMALMKELEMLQTRHEYLKGLVSKHKMFEDYLMKILDVLPESYSGNAADSPVMSILRRHETLSITHQDLVGQLVSLVEELELGQRNLEILKQEHNTHKLMINKELSELQTKWDRATERTKLLEMTTQMHQGQSRDQVEEVGSLLIAVRNLGEQCYLPHYGLLEEIDVLDMIDMIKEHLLGIADMEERVTLLVESDSQVISSSAVGTEKGSQRIKKKQIHQNSDDKLTIDDKKHCQAHS
ncbi:coiled-coil domain-containing protein 42 homolog isoform X1 [Alosa sapidissima]|uniref:coiled-coil domain-containing protein 42 homolog isoform X1 n=1 Tax=Alosa sapidissima TaxID=34773 RepID=UPI001C08179D|nr:coiled-coil domain-containing protein 42 homolog isoform X1 [Alosa sapidissima]